MILGVSQLESIRVQVVILGSTVSIAKTKHMVSVVDSDREVMSVDGGDLCCV